MNICFLQIYTHTQFVSNIYIIKLVSINQKIKQDLINIIIIFKNYVSKSCSMTNFIKKIIIKSIGCDLELTQSANEILNTLAVSFFIWSEMTIWQHDNFFKNKQHFTKSFRCSTKVFMVENKLWCNSLKHISSEQCCLPFSNSKMSYIYNIIPILIIFPNLTTFLK